MMTRMARLASLKAGNALHAATAAGARNAVERDLYSRQRRFLPLDTAWPYAAVDAFVSQSASVVGDVLLDASTSVWHGAVLRGDLHSITLGAYSNVQDRAVVGTARSVPTGLSAAVSIGHHVSIGAGSVLRSVTVEPEVFIGSRCVLMEGSIVESGAMLADGTVLPPGRRIPGKQLWGGNPARFIRDLTYDELAEIPLLAEAIAHTAADADAQLLPHVDLHAYNEAMALRAAAATAA